MPKDISKPIPDAALDDRLGFVGTTGSGKTYNAGVCVERLLARGARVVIIDPLDVWYGLRVLPDGETASPYNVVIFGGAHADLPINEHAGALLGETVAGMAESCIVSLGSFETAASERRFMLAFLTALYRHTTREPLHLIFDEADMLAPQRVLDKEGDANKLLGRMEQIVRRGRVRGFVPWLITQRPAVINKNVLSQMDGLVAFKLTSRQDRDALGSWVEGQADRGQWRETDAALATLPRGTGVVWLPGHGVLETVAFPEKQTFDSSATPKRGEKKRAARLKPLNLEALKERLGAIEEEAAANDPGRLKKRIAELEAKVRIGGQASPNPHEIAEAEGKGYNLGHQHGYREGVEYGLQKVAVAREQMETIVKGMADALAAKPTTISVPSAMISLPPVTGRPKTRLQDAPKPQPATVRAKPVTQPGNVSLTSGAAAILKVACERHPVRLTWGQITTMLRRKARGGSFNTARKAILDGGYATEDAGRVVPADAAFALTGVDRTDAADAAGDMLEVWLAALPSAAADMLKAIVEHGPFSREKLAAHLGRAPHGGSWNTAMKTLRDNELVKEAHGLLFVGDAIS